MNKLQHVKTIFQSFFHLLKETFNKWKEREPFNNSNIIAYYTIFSLPGLLVIVINLAGYFFGKEAVTHQITGQIGGIIGGDTAKAIQDIIAKTSQNRGLTISSIIGFAVLLFGATGVFYQVQQILNKIWEVKAKPKQKFLKLIRDRIFSFGLILVIAFLLLVSLVLSAGLTALSDWVSIHVSEYLMVVFRVMDIVISISVITLLFASIYKFLPDVQIAWKDVWGGAFLTSVLFVIAKFALGLYFGNSNPASTYGAAGSIILIMLWVSYAGLILLFGAEFTKVSASQKGKKMAPVEGAMLVDSKDNK
ncbi:MAG: YihY/virulence factor BrkB family protein [Cytophagaceae bacterium]|jgi:membrane protein|nr:YihY/virulence factor BrkB family protein [Cytophagaceae bacterium]